MLSANAIIWELFSLFLSNIYLPDLFLCVIALAKTSRTNGGNFHPYVVSTGKENAFSTSSLYMTFAAGF